MNNKTYTTLQPSYSTALSQDGKPIGFSTDQAVSLFASTSFLYSLGIMIAVLAAGVMYMRAGALRIKASEGAIRKSNEEIKRTTLGLLGVLSLFVIIYTFNKDLLTGEVGLGGLKSGGVSGGGLSSIVSESTQGTAPSTSCADPKTVIASLSSTHGVCGGTSCSALTGCAYTQYLPLIESKAAAAGIKPSIVIALMCRESKGKADAQRKNTSDGSFDCGLMQINQKTACDATILDPTTNIDRGISLLQQKMKSTNQVYQNIPPILGVLASYNCCGGTTVANAPSSDCNQASGFPYPIPKWACPINPGDTTTNMCFVKGYACDIQACIEALDSM